MDIEVLFNVRQFVKKALATELVDDLKKGYRNNQLTKYEYHCADVGKRAFKNRCLSYLTEINDKLYYQLAYEQFKNSDNMTDVVGSLSALINHDCEERDQALEKFYQQWKDQPLIVNKWFSLQASSTLPSTFETVKKLTQHPAFNIKNPNNIHSLLAVFGANVVRFHNANGDGYRLIVDYVLKIDPVNPQVAARILQPLTRWKIMNEKYQALMKAELTRVARVPKLSTDVYEIVMKSL